MTDTDYTVERTVPKVYVVSRDEAYRGEMQALIRKFYDVSLFDDASAAAATIAKSPPSVVISETDPPPKGGLKLIVDLVAKLQGPIVSFLVTRRKGKGFPIAEDNFPGPAKFLSYPFAPKLLFQTLAVLISDAASVGWERLPELQKQSLKLTVEEYQKVADDIAKGKPISYGSAEASCGPLVEAIKQDQHHSLLKSVQAHHNYTYVHSMRVATLLTMFGRGLGMKGDNLKILSTGGLLHDVGKIVTPPQILDKPGKLTEEEWPTMRNHVVRSGELLDAGDDITKGAQIIAEQHHEKIDGTGYPLGLKGAEMNELARMSSIVDIFGALTDARSYKPAFPADKAFAILEDMGPKIDQNLLSIFRAIFTPGSDVDTIDSPPVAKAS